MCVRGGGGEAVDLYSPRSLSFFLSFCCSSNMQKSTKERERAQMSDKRVRGLRTAVYLFCGAVSIPFFLYILNVYSRTETTTINKYLAATTAVLATRERGEESAASQAKCAPQ